MPAPFENLNTRNPAARWLSVLITILVVLVLPRPATITENNWLLFAIFAATMVGLVVQPLPGGAMVFLGVCALAVSGVVPIASAFAGYGDPVVWLVLCAFFISTGMIRTGLGRRIALHFIRVLGRTSLGLAYALGSTELVLGSIIPSTGARSGGIIFPIGKSLAEAYDSYPGPTARRLGAFLMPLLYNTNVIVCAMFLTGQASNPLIASFARDAAGITLTYGKWIAAAIVPGLLSFALVPLLIYRICPPDIKHTPAAAERAAAELLQLGGMKRNERIMFAVFLLCLALWLTKAWHPIDYVAVALLGVAILMLTGVLTYKDLLEEDNAWDVFLWYGGIIQLARLLGETGVTKWFAGFTADRIAQWPWGAGLIVLALVYFYAHYGFASITAHATAMFVPFLTVCIALGAPPLLTVLVLTFFSNLSASLTHYGTTPAPIYYGAGYNTQREWWRVGFAVSVVNILIWGIAGAIWWKVIGWW